jgi:hypothetical protein
VAMNRRSLISESNAYAIARAEKQLVAALSSPDWMKNQDRKCCELIRGLLGCSTQGAMEVLGPLYVQRRLIQAKCAVRQGTASLAFLFRGLDSNGKRFQVVLSTAPRWSRADGAEEFWYDHGFHSTRIRGIVPYAGARCEPNPHVRGRTSAALHSRIGGTGMGMCEEAGRLLSEYNRAVIDASKATKKLADLAGISSADAFLLLCNEKTRAKARVKKAQAAYQGHLRKHGCAVRSTGRCGAGSERGRGVTS